MWERASVADHYREVFRFVRRRVGSIEDAEDITQETFANATAALADSALDAPSSLAWLYTVARRRMVDEVRRRSRAQTIPLELVDEPATQAGYGEAVAGALRAGLADMPEGQRIVVVGRLLQGRSFDEIARELCLTEDACRMRLMRGLQHLRDTFEKEGLT